MTPGLLRHGFARGVCSFIAGTATSLGSVAAVSAAPPAAEGDAAPSVRVDAPASTAAVSTPAPAPPLPDPTTWKQDPPPVLERPRPIQHVPKVEIGVDAGVVSRPAEGDRVHYGLGWAVGGHARVNLASWLGARFHARFEGNAVTFDDGALGLPSGTRFDSPNFQRVVLGFALEPTFSPIPPLDLWVGIGVNWSRTTVGLLHTSGTETVVLPIRSAVFVEFPLSVGLRYHVVPGRLVLNLIGAASALANQSGRLESEYQTPGASGLLVRVGGFPGFGTSVAALAGVGVLL
jgi:hypothetical protein